MNKNYIIPILIFFVSFSLFSQNTSINDTIIVTPENTVKTPNYQNNTPQFEGFWSFGGSLGLSFWNGGTDILIGPKAYYNFSPKFLSGFGLTYSYSEFNNNTVTSYHSNSFGGSVMLGVRPIHFLQISTEYEGLQTNYSGYYSDEYFLSALYLGIAYVTGPVSFGLRYDLLYDENKSVYGSALSPVVGFYF